MKKKMTVARALKEKARLTEKVEVLHQSIAKYNSIELGEHRPVVVRTLLGQLANCQENLLRVKEAIAQANSPIERKLAELMMLRGEIKFFKGLNTAESIKVVEYGREEQKRVACDVVVKEDESLARQEELKDRLDSVQDEVDTFNAITTVEVDMI